MQWHFEAFLQPIDRLATSRHRGLVQLRMLSIHAVAMES
jgi:hypothetical protein